MRKKVYIASPYWNHDPTVRMKNVYRQIETSLILIRAGLVPYWPLGAHYLSMINNISDAGPIPETMWLELSREWIGTCDILLRLDGESNGADIEVQDARELGIPIYFDLEFLLEEHPT
jgi:hypothetical protein